MGLYLPAAQSVHIAAAPRENLPKSQDSQGVEREGVGLTCPGRQSVQNDDPEPENLPEAQISQNVLDLLASKTPAAQLVQSEAFWSLNFPTSQLMH